MPRNSTPVDVNHPVEKMRAFIQALQPVPTGRLAEALGVTGRELWSLLSQDIRRGFAKRNEKGEVIFLRHPDRRPKGKGIQVASKGRQKPTKTQALGVTYPRVAANGLPPRRAALPGMGFAKVPDAKSDRLPCTESWLAANANNPNRYQLLSAGDVSPASRFKNLRPAA